MIIDMKIKKLISFNRCSVRLYSIKILSNFLNCRSPHGHFGKVTARRALKNKEKVKE